VYKIHLNCAYHDKIELQESAISGVIEKVKRININLSDKSFEELQELSRRKGKNMSETLRDALALEKWFQDARDKGSRVLIEHGGTGIAREIIPR
jgi:molybdopterin biosynthesis enzyme MoaB